MEYKQIATLRFQDLDSSDEALAIVKASPDRVSLGLSLKTNGDLEVSMRKEDARALVDALTTAVTGI